MTACVSLFSFAFVFLAFLVVGPRVALLATQPATSRLVSAGHVDRALARERHRVIREMDARGPFCQHVISVTVAKDFLVVALFALNVEFAALANLDFSPRLSSSTTSSFPGSEDVTRTNGYHTIAALFAPVLSVAAATLFGVALGAALGRATKPRFLFFAVGDDWMKTTTKKTPFAAVAAATVGSRPAARSRSRREPKSSPFCCAWWRARRAPTGDTPAARANETLFAATSASCP